MSSAGPSPLHVLVVDDSALVRQAMTAILEGVGDIRVTVAADPLIAMRKMADARPDVILLDLEMPRMDGLSFLRRLMAEDPIPVVVCSSLAGEGTQALEAMEEGAVAVVAKPRLGIREFLQDSAILLEESLRGAAAARLRRPPARPFVPAAAPRPALPLRPPGPRPSPQVASSQVVALAASTGGTEALRVVLEAMPLDAPGIAIVQHMPEVFTRAFAERLNATCAIEVKEAAAGDRIAVGRALIAPGNRHMSVVRDGTGYAVDVADGPLVSRHRPSADVLFRSVAATAGRNALGVVLTGMGGDGAAGLLEMKHAGASTLAQDEASCVVFGMPKEAIARGGVDEVVPLDKIAAAILRLAQYSPRASPPRPTPSAE
jgi:two-component system, chemotaxis family, protein-glutamate methylesterase/glutaminase